MELSLLHLELHLLEALVVVLIEGLITKWMYQTFPQQTIVDLVLTDGLTSGKQVHDVLILRLLRDDVRYESQLLGVVFLLVEGLVL